MLPVAKFLGENPTTRTANDALAQRDEREIPNRFGLLWIAGQRGKPGLNADIQNAAEATRMIADPDFELLGTNATSGSSAFNVEGGITLTTAGASADQVILVPHLDANQSAWAQVTWGTDREVRYEELMETGSSIAAVTIWSGLKTTNAPTVNNDCAYFFYEPATNGGKWQIKYSIGGVNYTMDTGVTVAASTRYLLGISIDSTRKATFTINGAQVGEESLPLTNAIDLIPYLGVQADAAAAKAIVPLAKKISRRIGASG